MKNEIRKELTKIRNGCFNIADSKIIENAAEQMCRESKKNKRLKVCCYVSILSEVETKELIKTLFAYCDIYVPVFIRNQKPVAAKLKCADKLIADLSGNLPNNFLDIDNTETQFDFIFTPMLGFNANLFRIGYGAGWYDKFFKKATGQKVGLAFTKQETEFHVEDHDIPLDVIITEKGTRQK